MYAEFIKHEGLKTGGEVTDAAALKQDTEAKKRKCNEYRYVFYWWNFFSCDSRVNSWGSYRGRIDAAAGCILWSIHRVGTYTVIYAINQATFYFLPIFIGFSAANRLKSNGFLGGLSGGNPAVLH